MTVESSHRRLLSETDDESEGELYGEAPDLYSRIPDDPNQRSDGSKMDDSIARAAIFELTPEGDLAKAKVKKRLKKRHKRDIPGTPTSSLMMKTFTKLRETASDSCCDCNRKSCRGYFRKLFPFVHILDDYSALYDLPCDLIAGLTVGIMHIPQGMAYALLAQLPAVYGLYTSFFPVLLYFLFGTSKHISVGTFAVISLMVGAVVDKGYVSWQRQELTGAFHDLQEGHNISLSLVGTAIPGTDPTSHATTTNNNESFSVWQHLFRQQHQTELEHIKVGYALAVTFCVGLLQVFLGMLKLGFLTSFLSDPLISGFTTGAAVHVFSSQIKAAFGVQTKRFSGPLKLVFAYHNFLTNIRETNMVTFTSTVTTVLVLVLVKECINNNEVMKARMKGIPVPAELMVIIGGTILSNHYSLHRKFHVQTIGHIPKGFPIADLSFVQYLPDVIGEAFTITFTAFATSFAVAKILADKHSYEVDANQELIAHGVSNIFGSMVSSYCSAASLSRSMVQDAVGGKTQIVSLFSSVLVGVVLVALGPLFRDLPTSILAAIIIVSLKGLFLQFREVPRLWWVSKVDCTVWLITFWSTVLLDVDLGLLIGLIYNLVPILLRTQRPYTGLLGNLPNTDVYVNSKLYRDAQPVPGVKIFKFEAPLYFANMEYFRQALISETGLDPQRLRQIKKKWKETDMTLRHHEVCIGTSATYPDDPCESHDHQPLVGEAMGGGGAEACPAVRHDTGGVYALVIDCSAIQYVDSVTVRVLKEIVLEFRDVDIEVYLGECKDAVRAMLSSSGFYNDVYRRNVCATIHHAVQVACKARTMSSQTLVSCQTMAAEEFLTEPGFDDLDLDSSSASTSLEHMATHHLANFY